MEEVKMIREDGKWTKDMWVMSILSDAQELIHLGMLKEAVDKINKAKRVNMGYYKEIDSGFMIEVIEPKRKIEEAN
jgi:hypothetical protein